MICYRLRCAAGHEFEGWYRDSATFAQLQAGGFLSCPECGHADVQQALMAPAIAKKRSEVPAPRQIPEVPSENTGEKPVSPVLPDQMVAAFQKIRQAVETGCENVGDRFAEEALRMHHKKAPGTRDLWSGLGRGSFHAGGRRCGCFEYSMGAPR